MVIAAAGARTGTGSTTIQFIGQIANEGWRLLNITHDAVSRLVLRGAARVVVAAATVIAVAGCSNTKDNMQTVAEHQIIQQVHQQAIQIAQVAGGELKILDESAAPCEGRRGELSEEIYTVQGSYQLPIPEAEHDAALARLRDAWQQQGYTITTDQTVSSSGYARLEADNPDRYHLFVASTIPPTMLAVGINSPCYRSPTP